MTEETVEAAPPLNDGFDQPQVIDKMRMAFSASVSDLMPNYADIPEEFRNRNDHTEWNKFVSHWFFYGQPHEKWDLYRREDVNADQAWDHLTAIMRSWEPKHEHKMATVAWLLSRWFLAIHPKEKTS